MRLNLIFKAYKTKKLKRIHTQIDTAGHIWNHCIALQRRHYSLYGKYIQLNAMQKHMAKIRNRKPLWKSLLAQTLQEVCERVDIAYRRFFKGLATRPPKYKKPKDFKSFVLKLKSNSCKVRGNKLVVFSAGVFKFTKTREYENVKRIAVKRNNLGEIFFIFCCDMKPKPYERVGDATIGLDFGLKTFLTCSDGKKIESPEFYKNSLSQAKLQQRSFDKKVEGSNNKSKALNRLRRTFSKSSDRKKDFEWKLAHELCKHNKFIAIEDLSTTGMLKLWGRKISDLSFRGFSQKLEYVALKYDTIVQKVDRFYPSSRLCTCGVKNEKLTLKEREWTCESCGSVHQRDLLAANNILSEGIRLYRTKCETTSVAV